MKQLPILSLLLFSFLMHSCSQEEALQPQSKAGQQISLPAAKAGKVNLCHYDDDNDSWHIISVNANALKAHLNHGDVQLIDADGDGYVASLNECVPGGDCDDSDPEVYPGAEEICGNGIDDNCDGQIDENCCDTEDIGYPTVEINGLVWTAQNLDIDIPGSVCYNPTVCPSVGRMYNVVQGQSACQQLGDCWRLPTMAEFRALINSYSSPEAAYQALQIGGSSGFETLTYGGIHSPTLGSVFYNLHSILLTDSPGQVFAMLSSNSRATLAATATTNKVYCRCVTKAN